MSPVRVVLFGATGYTGELTARAMAGRGLRPVLAGRRPDALAALARDLGGLEVVHADVERPASVHDLVARGDVLVTTVGPMTRLGEPALAAALEAGAHYVDVTGESAFVRHVFEEASPRAERAGCALLPAMAYDSVLGNLAGTLAIREARGTVTRLRVGYFVSGARRGLLGGLRHMSGGSRATFAAMALEPSFAWRGGRIVTERGAARVGGFEVDGERLRGVSFGTSEAYVLPRAHPRLRDVEVYFGWFDRASRLMQAGSLVAAAARRVPGAPGSARALARRLAPGSSGGPPDSESGSLFVAEAYDAAGACLARVRFEGINGYEFSGRMLAWAAERVAAGDASGSGALGPVEAFGLEAVERGVAECGIARVVEPAGKG